jgi:hypothetical protein
VRTYHDLVAIESFNDRFEYLKLGGKVGESTFGFERYLNQTLYRSEKWKRTRDKVIIRDSGCDLGHSDFPINGKIIIHHMNPITVKSIEDDSDDIYDPEFLVCVSMNTHNAIHYGDANLLPKTYEPRRPGDTCPWK